MLATTAPAIEWDDRPGDEAQRKGYDRGGDEHEPVGAARDDRLLDQQFEPIGEGLQQSERADNIWPLTQLRIGQHLALDIGQISDGNQQRHDDRDHLADGDDGQPGIAMSKSYPCVPVCCRELAAGAPRKMSLHSAIVGLARLIGSVR